MDDRALSRLLHEVRRTAAGDGVGDAELLGRFAATGDEAAFELLVRRYQRLVFGVCRRVLHDHHDAEDAFQATFLALARKARDIGKREAVAGWLFRVAYRAALAARAGRARRIDRERAVAASPDAAACADGAPERRDLCAAVDEEVNRLPERFRTAAVLCYLEGKTVDEAARLLGCPRGTVASRLARAKARLRGRLSRRGLDLTAAVGVAADGLIQPTVRAAVLYASGKVGQSVSLPAVALAKKVVRAMFLKKLTAGATVAAALAGVLLLGGGLSAWLRAKAAAAPPAALVAAPDKDASPTAATVSRPVRRELAPSEEFTGRLAHAEMIPVVARVTGPLVEAPALTAPQQVKKGELLYRIDPAPFKEVLADAEAKRDAAAAGPERDAAETAVRRARLDLEATQIVAPTNGGLGAPQVLARADARFYFRPSSKGETAYGTWGRPVWLAKLNPDNDAMGVQFEMDERTYIRYRRAVAARDVVGLGGPLFIGMTDETGFPHEAVFVDFAEGFNPGNGTIAVHADFPDPDHLFLPGMFARVRVPFGQPAPVLETASEAVFADLGKKYVWVVNDHNVVDRRDVQLGQGDGDLIVVKEGLSANDWIVVSGGKDLHPGDKIEPCRMAMPGSKPADKE
jgi:RNA polymerase sigma factor (sigma-70 family)